MSSASIELETIAPWTYAFCDPAGGKQRTQLKRLRARSAIVVVTADWLVRLFVRFAWGEACSTDRLIDRIFEVNETYKPRVFGIEANAMQSLFADGVIREGRHRGVRIPIVPVTQPVKVEKDFRIRSAIQPVISEGRLFVPEGPDFVELRAELQAFPLGMTKDIIDALASAIALCPRRAPDQIRNEEAEQLASYLRASGVDPQIIEERVRLVLRNSPRRGYGVGVSA